jgi:hypothetical protein
VNFLLLADEGQESSGCLVQRYRFSAPRSTHCTRSSTRLRPVSTRIGMLGLQVRRKPGIVAPSIRGRFRSSTTRSKPSFPGKGAGLFPISRIVHRAALRFQTVYETCRRRIIFCNQNSHAL